MNISKSLIWFLNPIQLSHTEQMFLQTLLYPVTSLWQVFCQLSSLTIAYPNLGSNSSSLTFLVPMFSSCRTNSYHTTLCRFHSSSFPTKCILLEMCLVCLVYLPFLSIHIADLLFNIMRGACYETTYVSLFKKSSFITLICDRAIPALHAALY